jgi:hypothetical protein
MKTHTTRILHLTIIKSYEVIVTVELYHYLVVEVIMCGESNNTITSMNEQKDTCSR